MRSGLAPFAAAALAIVSPLVQQAAAAALSEPSGQQVMLGAWVDTSVEGA